MKETLNVINLLRNLDFSMILKLHLFMGIILAISSY